MEVGIGHFDSKAVMTLEREVEVGNDEREREENTVNICSSYLLTNTAILMEYFSGFEVLQLSYRVMHLYII